MPLTDDELIAKIADGDGSAFAELYDRYYTPVLCFAKKRIWVRQDAEDAAQDVMLRVCSNARLYLQGTSVRAWIYSIAKNVIVDRIRGSGMDAMDRCRRLDGGDVGDGERSHFKSREPEPSCDRLALDEISGIIESALDAIPEEQREAFILFVYGDRDYRDIAGILCEKHRTIQSRIRMAMEKVRRSVPRETILEYAC